MGWEGLGDGEKVEVSLWAVGQSQETGPHPLGCGRLAGAACQLPVSLSQDGTEAGVPAASGSPGLQSGAAPGPAWDVPTIFPATARSHFWRKLVSDSRGKGVLWCFGNSYS